MTLNEYQERASATALDVQIYFKNAQGEFVHVPWVYPALGLGEAGEVQNKIKKILRDNDGVVTPEARLQIMDELGDELWYVAETCRTFKIGMEELGAYNLEKLARRQANGTIKGSGDR